MEISPNYDLIFRGLQDKFFVHKVKNLYKNDGLMLGTTFNDFLPSLQADLEIKTGSSIFTETLIYREFDEIIVRAESAHIEINNTELHTDLVDEEDDGLAALRRLIATAKEDMTYVFDAKWIPVMLAGALAVAYDYRQRRDQLGSLMIDGDSGEEYLGYIEAISTLATKDPEIIQTPQELTETLTTIAQQRFDEVKHASDILKQLTRSIINLSTS